MKLCKLVMAVSLIFALLLAGCGENAPQTQPTVPTTAPTVPTTEPTTPTTVPETQPSAPIFVKYAPNFTVYDREGNTIRLSDFRGKPVVLNFWSSNCPPCRAEMPDFQASFEKYGQDIHFVMVNLTDGYWDNPNSAKAFVDGLGYTFPIYLDIYMEAVNAYSISSIPSTFFINAAGSLVTYSIGMLDAETLQAGINQILE